MRFQPAVPGSILPGLIFSAIRERFPKQQELPAAQIPEPIRSADPTFRRQAVVAFHADERFALHVGPQVVFLSVTGGYPGWSAISEMLDWLVARFRGLGFIRLPERLGLRYLDFFRLPLAPKLRVNLALGNINLSDEPTHISCQLQRAPFLCLLQINTSSMVQIGGKQEHGAVLDLDVGLVFKPEVRPEEFFAGVMSAFEDAHELQKRLFFEELVRTEFLATLNPQYD